MENLKKLQTFILKVILFLIWLDLVYFALMAVGTVFKWASLGSGFHALIAMSFGILAMLSVLHIVLTLNIMSRSIELIAGAKGSPGVVGAVPGVKKYTKWMVAAITGIVIIVAAAGFADHSEIKRKNAKTQEKVGEATRSALTARIIDLIEKDAPASQLYFVRDELLLSMGQENGITLLIPKQGAAGQVFYQITPWDSQFPGWTKDEVREDKPISQSLATLFLPRQGEDRKYKQMLEDQKPFVVAEHSQCRAFWPVVRGGKIKMILVSDADLSISMDALYSRSSHWKKTA